MLVYNTIIYICHIKAIKLSFKTTTLAFTLNSVSPRFVILLLYIIFYMVELMALNLIKC